MAKPIFAVPPNSLSGREPYFECRVINTGVCIPKYESAAVEAAAAAAAPSQRPDTMAENCNLSI